MMKPLKTPTHFRGLPFNSGCLGILIGLLLASAFLQPAQAIDLQRPASVSTLAKTSTNGAPDLDQLTRDLQRFLGGARAAALQRGAGQKAAVNTVKDPATNAQPSWWVTAAENGTARQIKRVGRPVVSSPVQAKAKRTEAETMAMVRSFLSSQSPALKLQDPNAELALVSSETDSLGYRHFRYTQKLKEIPVWPTGLTVHLAPDGELHLITASIVPTPSAVSRVPGIEADKAVERAKAKVPGGFRGTHTTPELILHWDSDATATPVRLAWKFRVSVGEQASWTAIMDAQTGGEISIQSDARTGSVMGSGTDLFGIRKTFPVVREGSMYYMVDITKNGYDGIDSRGFIAVLDRNETQGVPKIVSSSSNNDWRPLESVSVYLAFSGVYDYFNSTHGQIGFSKNNDNIIAVIRDASKTDNAWYQHSAKSFHFGVGKQFAKCIDIIGHEFTHGIVDHSAGLIYENQSGALNESFSDIFGEMVELYMTGTNDWKIAATIGKEIRNLAQPESLELFYGAGVRYPAKMSQFIKRDNPILTNYVDIPLDAGGVHINSSIINKSFYILSAATPPGVASKIYFRCLTKYLNKQSKFIDCRLGCVNAAEDLYPSDPSIKKAVEAAFDSVEIYDGNPTPAPGSFPPVNAPDSYLVLFSKTNQSGYSLARREEAEMDHFMQSYTKIFDSVSRSKPIVSGDGAEFVFVTSDGSIGLTTTRNPVVDLKTYGRGVPINSVAIAPDGSGFALVMQDSNQVILWQSKTGVVRTNQLYSPGSEGVLLNNINRADVVSFSPDGRFLVYDAAVPSTDGLNRELWSIYLMDVATGQIWHLINSGDDYDVGNPAFGHTSNNFITFERINRKTGVSTVMVYDQFSNRHSEVAIVNTVNGFGFPEFNGDDSVLVFSDTDSTAKATGRSLFKVRLDKNRQLVAGTRSLAIQEASMAVVYRRGAYRTTNEPPTVTWTSPASGSSVPLGASVTLAVSAADQDGIDRVEFWQGGKMLGEVMQPGEVPQPSFSLSVPMTSAGTFGIVARAFDTYGASADSASIQVTVAPVLLAKVADQSADEGTLFRLDLGSAAGTKPGLAFSLVSGPSGLSISSAGLLTWAPTEDQGPSLASVEIAATDGISRMTDRFSVQVREVNQPPVLSPVPTLNAKAGVALNYTLQASDPDRPAQVLNFALESGPSGLTVGSGGAVRWTPTLNQISTVQAVTVSVSDGALKATTQFSIQVGSDPLPVSPTNVVWSVDGIAGNFIETPDGNIVAGGNGMVRCFSGGDGKELWRVPASDNNDTAVWEFLPGYIDDDGAVIGKYKREVFNPTYAVNHGLFVVETAGGVLRLSTSILSTNTDYNPYGAIRGLRHRELLLQSSTGVGVYEIGKGFRWKRSDFRLNPDQWIPVDNLLIHSDTQPNFIGTVLFAYDLSNGNLRWTSRLPGSFSVNQLLFDGVSRIIVAKRETVHAVDVFSGQELWRQGGGFSGENSLVILSDHKTLDRFFYFQGQATGYANFIDIRLGQNRFNPLQGNVNGQWLGGFGFTGGAVLSTGSRIVKINSVGTNAWPFLTQGEYIASIGSSGINWSFPINNDTAWLYSVLANGRLLVSGYTDGKLMALQGEGAWLSSNSPWPYRLRTAPRYGNYGVFGLGSADSGLTSLYSFDGHADDLVSACDAPEGLVGTAGFAASGGPRAGYLKPDRGADTRFDSGFMRTNSPAKSLAVWIRLPELSAGSVKLLDGGDEDPSGFAGMNLTASAAASGTQVTFNLGAGASASWQAVSAVSPKRSRQWVHVTAVLNDSGVQQLYLDGVLAASAAGRSSKAIARASTAAMTLPAAVGFDDLRTYLRTVTADEVAQIFAAADPVVEPPVIVTQPVASLVNAGATAVFSVVATGTAPFTYQWRRNGGDLAGETNATLTVAQVQAANAGDYSVVVGNSAGSITSAGAALAVNTPPTFVGLRAASVPEGSELSVQLVTADSDLPAQKLTVRLVSGPTGLVVSPQGLVSWIPTEAQGPQVHPVTVEVSDGSLSTTGQFEVTVSEVNRPPLINPLAATSVSEGTAWSQTLTASDPDLPANGLTFRLVTGPTGASLDPKTGVLRWTPSETDGGTTVALVVELTDDGQPPLASQITAQLTVNEVNSPPVLAALADVTAPEGGPWSMTVRATDSDLPAQSLTYALKGNPPGVTLDSGTGELRWTPSESQGPGTFAVTVSVTDSGGATAERSLTVKVTEVNQPPTLAAVADQGLPEGQTLSLSLSATDVDLPVQPLTYALVSGPAGLTVSAAGVVSWTPTEAQGPTTQVVTVSVTDGVVTVMRSFSVNVAEVNQPPVLAAVADQSLSEGQTLSLSLSARDADLPAQSLTYALVSGPVGLTVNPAGVVSWTPTEAQGPITQAVTVSVTDGVAVVYQSFLLTVTEVNQPPQVAAWGDQRVVFGQSVKLKMEVTDADLPANRLTYRIVGGPDNLVLSEDGQLAWSPARNQAPSTNRIAVAVSDGIVSVTNSVRIEVFELVMAVNGTEATDTVNAPLNPRISFRCGRPDWLVYYSLNGQPPTFEAPSKFYLDPFLLPATATVWPIAFSPDFTESVLGVPVRVAMLKAQTLDLQGGLGLVHLGPGVPIEGKSDSGLPVTLAVISGPGRLESGRLIPTGGGAVRIRANQAGNDHWAPAQADFERIVARAAQTVVWQPLDAAVFGGVPLRLRAIASSGLPIEYLPLSGPGLVSGDQLQVNGAGQVVVRARQGGNADFDPATADLAVPVAKAPQTIVWDGIADRSFSLEVIPLNGKASSGLSVTYEVISGPAVVAKDRLTMSGVGTVVVRASQVGDTNHEAAPARQITFVVSKAAQTLAFGPIGSKTFGDGPVPISATSSAGLPVTYSVVGGPGSLAGDRLTLNGAGDVVIRASQAGNDLYQAASVTQTVTVAKAVQSLAWSPESGLTYRTNLIGLDAKASSGLPASYRVVSGPAVIVAGQMSLTGVGSVVVAAEQAGDANWLAAIAITNRFTVGRGVQVVTFEPIGDRLLDAGPVNLVAQASSGLPVSFSVLSGQAAVNDQQLTLLGSGRVTVRAIHPGSPLWLAASADQTFTVLAIETPPQVVIESPRSDGSFGLEIRAPVGVNLTLETTSDLNAWTEAQRLTGQGSGTPVKLRLQNDPNVQTKFWRVRAR